MMTNTELAAAFDLTPSEDILPIGTRVSVSDDYYTGIIIGMHDGGADFGGIVYIVESDQTGNELEEPARLVARRW